METKNTTVTNDAVHHPEHLTTRKIDLTNDTVCHPAHYTTGKIEVIDFIEDKMLNYHRGNAVKYIVRAGRKDPAKEIEDLQKAAWYIDREIRRLESLNPSLSSF